MEHPTLTEAAAVLAAVHAYRQARGLPAADLLDLRVHLAELKDSIDKLEGVTIDGAPNPEHLRQ